MAREKLGKFLSEKYGIVAEPGQGKPMLTFVRASTVDDTGNPVSDLGVDPGSGKELLDLATASAGLLGDWLNWLTTTEFATIQDVQRSGPYYYPDTGNVEASSPVRGADLDYAENTGAGNVYIKTSDTTNSTLGSELAKNSNSGKFDGTSTSLSQIVDKVGGNQDLNSAELLSSIVGSGYSHSGKTLPNVLDDDEIGDTDAIPSSIEILQNYNRFYTGKPPDGNAAGEVYIEQPVDITGRSHDYQRGGSLHRSFGQYTKHETQEYLGYDYNFKQIKEVGISLMAKAAGLDSAMTPGSSQDLDDIDIEGKEEDQSSRKIAVELLRTKRAKGFPTTDGTSSARDDRGDFFMATGIDSTVRSVWSYGTTTTPSSQFSSIDDSAITAMAYASISALKAVMDDFGSTIEGLLGGTENKLNIGRGPYPPGEYPGDVSARLQSLKRNVLSLTEYPYMDCVEMGINVLFGDSPGDDYQHIREAPGYWLAIARSCIRSVDEISKSMAESAGSEFDSGSVANALQQIGKSNIVGMFNVAAQIGNAFLSHTGGNPDASLRDTGGPMDVDILPDGPATRISKSRSGTGFTNMALAWRCASVPSIYLLPDAMRVASNQMGTMFGSASPFKALLSSRIIEKVYLDNTLVAPGARIPSDVVEIVENHLDAEYVPFYFHDLRTNEIVAFHAFLESLSDGFTPSYNSVKGYGRMDPVQIYQGTTRSISLSFHVVATSKDDFNEMWWKINKLTTLCYPQWTKGTKVETIDGASFVQPFSQIIGASPLIRMRIGDVIRGNYSRFNLARIFGAGDENIKPEIPSGGEEGAGSIFGKGIGRTVLDTVGDAMVTPFYIMYGSPLMWIPGGTAALRLARSAASQLLINGFANPIGLATVMLRLNDPDQVINPVPGSLTIAGLLQQAGAAIRSSASDANLFGFIPVVDSVYIKASQGRTYLHEDGSRWHFARPIRAMVLKRGSDLDQSYGFQNDNYEEPVFKGGRKSGQKKAKQQYEVRITDPVAPARLFFKKFIVTHADLMPIPTSIFTVGPGLILNPLEAVMSVLQNLANDASVMAGTPADSAAISTSDMADFMHPMNNPVTKAFESANGRGLAGVITKMDFTWVQGDQIPWEIDHHSRAPMLAKVTIQFSPIHDIPPGLDENGFNRAPIYNVGDIMKDIGGEQYPDNGIAAKASYGNAGRLGTRSIDEDKN